MKKAFVEEAEIQLGNGLQSILDNSVDAICRYNLRDQSFSYLSPGFVVYNIFGRSREEILNMSYSQLRGLISEMDVEEATILGALRKENAININISLRTPGGATRKLSCRVVPVIGQGKNLTHVDCFIRRAGKVSINNEYRNPLEDELQTSRKILKIIFDNTPTLLVIWTSDMKHFSMNRFAEKILGWTTREANSFDFLSSIFPDSGIKESAKDYMSSLQPGFSEWVCNAKSGEKIPVDWANVRLSNNLNIGIGIDLRERKAEAALKEKNEALENRVAERTEALSKSQLDLEHAQRIGNIGNWRFEAGTDRLVWSDETYRIFEIEPGTRLLFSDYLELVHPDDRDAVDRSWRAALEGKEYDLEYRILVNEKVKWVRQKAYLEFGTSGNMIAAFGITQDVTSRRMAEDKLKESESRLRLALESGNIGVWSWNLKTNKITWDEKMERMFGVPPGWFGGTYKEMERLIHEEDVTHFRKAIDDTLQQSLPFETIFRIRYGKRGIKYISSKAQIADDRNGKPVSISGVCFDITGMKEGTENLINRLSQELLRSNKELESFAYVASHDLQEPLRMITSFTQLLEIQYGDRLDNRAKEYIGFATDGAKRMYDLINSLLAYSRINKKEIIFSRIDGNKVVESVQKILALKIEEKNVKFKIENLPHVYGDYDQMIHLFQNLISNSIKFNEKSPEITISAIEGKKYHTYSIKDNGIGIEPQYFDRIFQIFQRLHPRDHYEGTGIGLAICKRIVERHGGRLWVESQPGKGSTFSFTLHRRAPANKSF
ncbi:MAG TPA: PAS domain-containing protein [Bacteroidales bacterium]|nr:PAS domain-containing protein [Bacteroidales bacterium]